MSLVYLCIGMTASLSLFQLVNTEIVLTDWNTGDGGFKWRPNCDFLGHDIGQIPITTATRGECGRLCIANPECSHFTFGHLENCYMKNAPSTTVRQDFDYESIGICGFIPWRLDSETERGDPELQQYQTQNIEMIPNEKERTIDAGTTLTLTCVYTIENEYQKNNFNFSWEIPDYLEKNVELSDLDNRLRKTFERNETHITSTLSLTNARTKDTGNFGCGGPKGFSNTHTVSQYVYVFSSTELIIIEGNEYYIEIPHGQTDYKINCRPTHPDVKVSLIHRHQYTARGKNWLEPKRDLLADPNSNWSFEPKTGLKLKKAKIDDTGHFECRGTYKIHLYSRDIYLYVGGTELNRTNGVGDPVEGSNVNLMCRTYVYTRYLSPPKWSYQINGNGLIAIINKTNPFEGIEIKEPDVFVYKDKTLYTSQLSLTNISPSKYRFQCQGSGFTEKISFQAKKLNGNLKSKYVQLKKNIAQNVTCFISTGSKGDSIIWLKDGKEYSGPVYSDNISSILPLQGKAEEKGSYACVCKNNFIEENYANFTVIAVPSIYPTSTETSVGHIPKSTTQPSIKHVPTSTETSIRHLKLVRSLRSGRPKWTFF